MNISTNILSYKRADNVDTIGYLPFANLWVCETEYGDYKKSNPNANIRKIKKGIQGNVGRVRNYILDKEFAGGKDAVCLMDDDFRGLYRHEVDKQNMGAYSEKISSGSFKDFLYNNSVLCREFGFRLWGVGINKDKLLYLHHTPFNTKGIVLGPFTVHLKNPIRYDERLFLKEDYDLCIQHINKYRGVLRLNMYFYDCKQSKNVGGCSLCRNIEEEKNQFQILQKKWGSRIVRRDRSVSYKSKKKRIFEDYNPIINIPIKGV